jgi:hypothetical protein
MRDHEESLRNKKEEQAKQVETAGSVGEDSEVKGTKAVDEKVGEEEVGKKEAISMESAGQENVGTGGSRKARVPAFAIVCSPAGGDSDHPAYPN